MRTRLAAPLLFSIILAAAAPAPKPVITLSGVATAAKLDATTSNSIAKQVTGLNKGLVSFVALHKSWESASAADRAKIEGDMKELHQHCMALHDEIVKNLTPDQRTAFYEYIHAQMKAAGIDMSQFNHDGMPMDSTHSAMHKAMAGAGHGG